MSDDKEVEPTREAYHRILNLKPTSPINNASEVWGSRP